jgi:IS4 transposase
MLNSVLERTLSPEKINRYFEKSTKKQYTRGLLFSSVFDLMGLVVFKVFPAINAAYKHKKDNIGVSITSVYNKLNGLEIGISQQLVRETGIEHAEIITELKGKKEALISGYRLKMLDGNCIEATEHRLDVLRETSAGPLPGKSLVVFDPVTELAIDVFPCEDGHSQERSLLKQLLPTVEKRDIWLMDRNFCVRSFLFGIKDKNGFFIVRQHGQLPYTILTEQQKTGETETGDVYEQWIEVIDNDGTAHKFRRIVIQLKKATRDKDKMLYIITNLPEKDANAILIANVYRRRWNIETMFQELESHLHSEINTLGYPTAALFGFCVALVAYNTLSVLKAALRSQYGEEVIANELSGYYIASNITRTYDGMMIAILATQWDIVRDMSLKVFCEFLLKLANNVDMEKYKKSKRGVKKPRPKRDKYKGSPHVSTAKLLTAKKTGKQKLVKK